MSAIFLRLTAHDPIVARDGRPFGDRQGNRMRGLGWPYPSVVAGSFRTALVKSTGGDFTGDTPRKLLEIAVAGVFPVADDELYFPAPADCVVHPEKGPLRASPQPAGDGGCDFPAHGLRPVTHREEVDFKPKDAPAWWPACQLVSWLTTGTVGDFNDGSFLAGPKQAVRDHVRLVPATGAAAEGMLFTTVGLGLTHLPRLGAKGGRFTDRYAPIALAARVEVAGWAVPPGMLHPLGGERRLVRWQTNGDPARWACPPTIRGALAGPGNVRMALATPAIFAHGWRPGWLNENTLDGTPPGAAVRLKLVGVCIQRWKAVSGWSLAPLPETGKPGPKPVKRLVPAGGVYFFKTGDDRAPLADRWLQPVSDDPQDRNDGFGLAVWGTW